jgi:hypothetical protein
MALDEEIATRSKDISTDSYAMSIGELLSLYRDKELNIHPEFQRFFRWSDEQKSRLIESLLLGIPIPPIFVSQDGKGKWDVIDGLQRLSTIFQLAGELRDEKGQLKPPLVLSGTKYLPSLASKRWNAAEGAPELLSDTAKLQIKRARIDLKIVLNKSDSSSKYELFDRLNTGGSSATEQEVRNCLLIMLNKDFFDWMDALAGDTSFEACVPLTERQVQEQFNMELVVRFLTLRTETPDALKGMPDLGRFLTERISILAQDPKFNFELEGAAFQKTFALLEQALGEDSFRKFNAAKSRSGGPLLVSLFETIALGIGNHMSDPGYVCSVEKIQQIHHEIWQKREFIDGTGSGVRPTTRIPVTIPLGRELFRM